MMGSSFRLHATIGATRPRRIAPPTGHWLADRAVDHGGNDEEVVDLGEAGLPLLDSRSA